MPCAASLLHRAVHDDVVIRLVILHGSDPTGVCPGRAAGPDDGHGAVRMLGKGGGG